MLKIALRILLILLCALLLGVIGFFIGAHIGGNYAQDFIFLGSKGYEAVGLIGFWVGVILTLITGVLLWLKKMKKNNRNDL